MTMTMTKKIILLALAAVTAVGVTRAQMASSSAVATKPPTPSAAPAPLPALPVESARDLLLLQRQILLQAATIQNLLAQIKATDLYQRFDAEQRRQQLTQKALADRQTLILSSMKLDPARYEIDLDGLTIREKAVPPPTTPKK